MNDAALLAKQIGYEQKAYWRNPAAAFFTFGFPLVFFFIFESIFGHGNVGTHADPISGLDYYTPSILAYAVMSACFLSIANQYVQRREAGIFKRMRGTPMPAWALIGGTIGNAVIVTLLLTTISLVFATTVYGVNIVALHLIPAVVTILLAAVSFCAIGIAVSSLIPNADSGPAIVNLPYFLMVFISGTYFPVHGGLEKVASYLPLEPFIKALQNALISPSSVSGWSGHDLLRIAIWGVIGVIVAVRRFKWAPRRG